MFHQEFESVAILRNYLQGRNPLSVLEGVADSLASQGGAALVAWLALGMLLGLGIVTLGRVYTRRVVHLFGLPGSFLPSQGLRLPAYVGWALSGGALGLILAVRHADWLSSLVVLAVCLTLGILAVVDWYTGLLPDELTLPLLWGGLLWSWLGLGPDVWQALGGAIVAYGFLLAVFHLYRWVRGREGMGGGDFKLAAALGAWVGVAVLPELLLLACALGVLLALSRAGFQGVVQSFPFGPCLSLSGVVFLLCFSP